MKKQKTYMVTIAVVVAVLSVLLFLVLKMPSKNNKDSSSSKNNSVSLVSVDSDDITNINFKNSDEFNIKIESSENTFKYSIDKLDESQKISKDEVDSILNTFSKLSASEKVTDDCEKMETFGLDNPKSHIKITFTNGDEKTFHLGNKAPLNSGTYLKIDDEKTVYLVENYVATLFAKSADDFIDTNSAE